MNLHSDQIFRTKSERISVVALHSVLVKWLINIIVVSLILLNSSG